MNDSVFLDTNMLVDTYSVTEPGKQAISRNLVSNSNAFISTQVLQELANVLFKKAKKPWLEIQKILEEVGRNTFLHNNTKDNINYACVIARLYGFSFYDSLIISAALDSGCSILYSEDLNHLQIIDNKLTIINPFL